MRHISILLFAALFSVVGYGQTGSHFDADTIINGTDTTLIGKSPAIFRPGGIYSTDSITWGTLVFYLRTPTPLHDTMPFWLWVKIRGDYAPQTKKDITFILQESILIAVFTLCQVMLKYYINILIVHLFKIYIK